MGSMGSKDKGRKWLWWFLGVIAAMQLYWVRELLAAFAIFAFGFALIAALIAGLYMLQKGWEAGVARLVASRHPVMLAVRRSVSTVEDWTRRPLRRPGSAPTRA
jgi:hypothetical protein